MTTPHIVLAACSAAVKSAPAGAIVIDFESGRVLHNGRCIRRVGPRTISLRIVTTVLCRGVGVHPYRPIIDAVWGDDPEGGPSNPRGYLQTILTHWRGVFDAAGVIVRSIGRGLEVAPASAAEIAQAKAERRAFRMACIERFKGRKPPRGRPRKLLAA